MQNAVAFGASQFSGVLLSNGSCRNHRLQNASVWRLAFKETCLVSMPSFWGNSSPAIRKGSRFRLSIIVSSSLENGRAWPQPGLKTTKVKFVLQRECSFGQSFSVVGDTPELGAWEASSGVPMTWSDGHIWSVDLDLPQGKRFEYKFLLITDPRTVEWQPGPNRVIPEEEDHVDSSSGNVATGEEELCSTQSLEGQYSLDESAHYSDMENMEDTKALALEDETLDQESSEVKNIEEKTVSKKFGNISSPPQSLLQSVKFVLRKECNFGQSFSVVGDSPELGAWDASSGVPMTWSDGHIWSVDIELPRGKRFEYKFLLIRDPHTVEWQPGPNRVFITHNNLFSLTVLQPWDYDEYANLKTQVIPEEGDHLDSSNGNVAIVEEELCSKQSLECQFSLDESAHYSDMENMEDTTVLALQEQLKLGIQQEDVIASSTTGKTRVLGIHDKLVSSIVQDETLDEEESSKVKYIEEETVSTTREGPKNLEDIPPQSSLVQRDIAWSVKFVLQKECSFGQSFSVVGDTPELGAWEASSGVPMTWSDGHTWSVDLELPQERFEYKILLTKDPHTVEWQPGPNCVFIAHNNLHSLTVSQSWDFDEYANLKTQVIPEVEDHLGSSNGNVAIGEEELCSTQSLEGQFSLDEPAHYSNMENMEQVQCNLPNHDIQKQLNIGIQQDDVITSSTTGKTRFLGIHDNLASSIVQDEILHQEESSSASKVKYTEEDILCKTREGPKNVEDISSPPQPLIQKDIAWSVKALSNLLKSFGLLKINENS